MCATWRTHTCDMTHWYVRRDSFIRETWLFDVCDMISHMYDMTHSNVCDMTHWCVWHDSLVHKYPIPHACLRSLCAVTYSYMGRDSFIRAIIHLHLWNDTFITSHTAFAVTVSTENATSPKSTKSHEINSSVSRGINSNWDCGFVSICTEKFVFLDLVDFPYRLRHVCLVTICVDLGMSHVTHL